MYLNTSKIVVTNATFSKMCLLDVDKIKIKNVNRTIIKSTSTAAAVGSETTLWNTKNYNEQCTLSIYSLQSSRYTNLTFTSLIFHKIVYIIVSILYKK